MLHKHEIIFVRKTTIAYYAVACQTNAIATIIFCFVLLCLLRPSSLLQYILSCAHNNNSFNIYFALFSTRRHIHNGAEHTTLQNTVPPPKHCKGVTTNETEQQQQQQRSVSATPRCLIHHWTVVYALLLQRHSPSVHPPPTTAWWMWKNWI